MLSKEKRNEILAQYCKGNTFVEIGAYDGETMSNTVDLADIVWKGYYFEPILEYASKCKARHIENNVQVFPVAVGVEGIRDFYQSDLLSTLGDKEYQDKVSNIEYFKGAKFTYTQVFCVDPKHIPECNLLVIDVEGAEYEILEQMKIKPDVIIVELHELSPQWESVVDINKSITLLENRGYTKVYSDDIDTIFVIC